MNSLAEMRAAGTMDSLLAEQRAAFIAEGVADGRTRIDRLNRALELLIAHQARWCEAAAHDFGQRPAAITRFMDIMPAVTALKLARRRVQHWMRPRRQRLGLPAGAPGSRGAIHYQPLGVVGAISPWNFPITLSVGPLAGILAAGNRCMLKPSEMTPMVSALIQELVQRYFDARELAVITGDGTVAAAFSKLAFDHLLYTGSGAVGKRVMAAAAEQLVPVTLELGGKCPVLLGRSANLARAVDRIMLGKLANAGQMCIAPDYVLMPAERIDEFVALARAWVARAYPQLSRNPDYTHLIDERAAVRMRALLQDASAQGARIVALAPETVTPAGEDQRAGARMVEPLLILGATQHMRVMQEEIFGPLLPVLASADIEAAVATVNAGPRPLALYYFGSDAGERRFVLEHTRSGGVTINGVGMHFMAEELPFGGIGASGMGAYHGEQGFRSFSHARAVYVQPGLDLAGLIGLRPPYGPRLEKVLNLLIRR